MDSGKDACMIAKVIGIIFVVFGCGGVGFRIAYNHRQEEKALRQLVGMLDFMACELQYRMPTLPSLCREVAKVFLEMPGRVFLELALEMESQISPDIEHCMSSALKKFDNIPTVTQGKLQLLGKSIGRFDLEGQLKGLEAVRQDCRRSLDTLSVNRDSRLRSYQTLGLCAGAALAILFI